MSYADPESDPDLARAEKRGHETRDASPRSLLLVGTGLAVLVAAAMGLVLLLMAWFSVDVRQGPIESMTFGRAGSEVRIRGERVELERRRRAALDRYRWIDREAGVAQIPIERAMEMIAHDPSLLEGIASATETQPPDTQPPSEAVRSPTEPTTEDEAAATDPITEEEPGRGRSAEEPSEDEASQPPPTGEERVPDIERNGT